MPSGQNRSTRLTSPRVELPGDPVESFLGVPGADDLDHCQVIVRVSDLGRLQGRRREEQDDGVGIRVVVVERQLDADL